MDWVPAMVSETIGDERKQALRFSKPLQDQLHDIDVHHLAVTAKIIERSRFPLEECSDNSGAMVFHMNPITHIHTVTVNWQRLLPQRFNNHERNQFFGKLKWAIVVRATRDDHFLPVCLIGSEREKIGAGFGCRIWGARVDR